METPPVTAKKTSSNSLLKNSLTPCRRVGLGRPSSGSLNKLVQVRTISTPPCGTSSIAIQNSLPASAENSSPTTELQATISTKQNDKQSKNVLKVRRCLTQNLKSNEIHSVGLKRTINEHEVKTASLLDETGVKSRAIVDLNNKKVKKHKSVLTSLVDLCSSDKVYDNKNALVCNADSTKTVTNGCSFEESREIPEEMIVQIMLSILEKKKKLEQIKVQETYAKKHNLEELRVQSAKWRAAGQEALRHCVRLAGQAGFTVTLTQLMQQHGFPPDLMGYNADDDEFE